VEEVFDAALIADEAEAFVDEEPCDGPGRHTVFLRCAKAWDNPRRFEDRPMSGRMKPMKEPRPRRAPT
jgi:hypothetical protein